MPAGKRRQREGEPMENIERIRQLADQAISFELRCRLEYEWERASKHHGIHQGGKRAGEHEPQQNLSPADIHRTDIYQCAPARNSQMSFDIDTPKIQAGNSQVRTERIYAFPQTLLWKSGPCGAVPRRQGIATGERSPGCDYARLQWRSMFGRTPGGSGSCQMV